MEGEGREEVGIRGWSAVTNGEKMIDGERGR